MIEQNILNSNVLTFLVKTATMLKFNIVLPNTANLPATVFPIRLYATRSSLFEKKRLFFFWLFLGYKAKKEYIFHISISFGEHVPKWGPLKGTVYP